MENQSISPQIKGVSSLVQLLENSLDLIIWKTDIALTANMEVSSWLNR